MKCNFNALQARSIHFLMNYYLFPPLNSFFWGEVRFSTDDELEEVQIYFNNLDGTFH